jgi:hypothetical protein
MTLTPPDVVLDAHDPLTLGAWSARQVHGELQHDQVARRRTEAFCWTVVADAGSGRPCVLRQS